MGGEIEDLDLKNYRSQRVEPRFAMHDMVRLWLSLREF
jgi:hypothetical protein